jgi:hypothetical protein
MKIDLKDITNAIKYLQKHSNDSQISVQITDSSVIIGAYDRAGQLLNINLYDINTQLKAKISSTEYLDVLLQK